MAREALARDESSATHFDDHYDLVKRERVPEGTVKLILRERRTGAVVERRE